MTDEIPAPGGATKTAAEAKTFMPRTLATLAALLSILSAGVGAFSAYSAEQSKEAAETATRQLELIKSQRDYQIHVFDMVDKSLDRQGGGLILASAYASSLDDHKVQVSLTEAIRAVAAARVEAGVQLTEAERQALSILTHSSQKAEAAAAAEASPSGQAASPEVAATLDPTSTVDVSQPQVNGKAPNPLGWDVDVFWCQARPASQAIASAVARQLGAAADTATPVGGEKLGRVRLRMLSTAAGGRGGFPTSTNEIRADSGEDVFADSLKGLISTDSHGYVVSRSSSNTRWYLSVFACGV